MKVTGITIWLPTKATKATLSFYVDHLRFKKLWDFDAYCMVSLDDHYLAFYPSDKMDDDLQKRPCIVEFQITEIPKYFDTLKVDPEIQFEQPLELMQPGISQFTVIDNNGYRIGFSQPTQTTKG